MHLSLPPFLFTLHLRHFRLNYLWFNTTAKTQGSNSWWQRISPPSPQPLRFNREISSSSLGQLAFWMHGTWNVDSTKRFFLKKLLSLLLWLLISFGVFLFFFLAPFFSGGNFSPEKGYISEVPFCYLLGWESWHSINQVISGGVGQLSNQGPRRDSIILVGLVAWASKLSLSVSSREILASTQLTVWKWSSVLPLGPVSATHKILFAAIPASLEEGWKTSEFFRHGI